MGSQLDEPNADRRLSAVRTGAHRRRRKLRRSDPTWNGRRSRMCPCHQIFISRQPDERPPVNAHRHIHAPHQITRLPFSQNALTLADTLHPSPPKMTQRRYDATTARGNQCRG
uniref:Uncharacterized protein n=1 Tax=Plectus sambesii TaxID=2011161 RepID=A0A914V3E5_9BILA